jgi:hypothetical protein
MRQHCALGVDRAAQLPAHPSNSPVSFVLDKKKQAHNHHSPARQTMSSDYVVVSPVSNPRARFDFSWAVVEQYPKLRDALSDAVREWTLGLEDYDPDVDEEEVCLGFHHKADRLTGNIGSRRGPT